MHRNSFRAVCATDRHSTSANNSAGKHPHRRRVDSTAASCHRLQWSPPAPMTFPFCKHDNARLPSHPTPISAAQSLLPRFRASEYATRALPAESKMGQTWHSPPHTARFGRTLHCRAPAPNREQSVAAHPLRRGGTLQRLGKALVLLTFLTDLLQPLPPLLLLLSLQDLLQRHSKGIRALLQLPQPLPLGGLGCLLFALQ
mmetsp:Transcript_10549/g.19804  ORF Transcript_10549/g.19804 Transcript_10549/m.19804 type:complete len:200 (+) Transcript_10549:2201-2800(+)